MLTALAFSETGVEISVLRASAAAHAPIPVFRWNDQHKESNGKDSNKGKHEAGAVQLDEVEEDVGRGKILSGNGKGARFPLQRRRRRPNEGHTGPVLRSKEQKELCR